MSLYAGKKRRPAVQKAAAPLHIVHISAEFAPIAKVGGLADVVTGGDDKFRSICLPDKLIGYDGAIGGRTIMVSHGALLVF